MLRSQTLNGNADALRSSDCQNRKALIIVIGSVIFVSVLFEILQFDPDLLNLVIISIMDRMEICFSHSSVRSRLTFREEKLL